MCLFLRTKSPVSENHLPRQPSSSQAHALSQGRRAAAARAQRGLCELRQAQRRAGQDVTRVPPWLSTGLDAIGKTKHSAGFLQPTFITHHPRQELLSGGDNKPPGAFGNIWRHSRYHMEAGGLTPALTPDRKTNQGTWRN